VEYLSVIFQPETPILRQEVPDNLQDTPDDLQETPKDLQETRNDRQDNSQVGNKMTFSWRDLSYTPPRPLLHEGQVGQGPV
jgi:hypothetical protein